MTDQQNSAEEAPQAAPAHTGKRVLSRTTLIAAIVVLAAIAVVIVIAMR